jgi:hypothetical protein
MKGPALMALALLACGGRERTAVTDATPPDASPGDAGPDAALAPDAATDTALVAADFAAAFCALLAPCCPDAARCRASVAAQTPYRAAMAEGCLAALRANAGAPAFCTAGFAASAQTCERVFAAAIATRRLAEPCTSNAECQLSPQGPVRCAGEMGMARCQVLLRGKEGDTPCVATVAGPLTVPAGDSAGNGIKGYLCHTSDGLWCDDSGARCAKARPAGGACTSFGECGAAATCDDASGKCAPRRGEGAACDVDEQCPSTICAEDNRCAPAPAVDPALAKLCARP